MMKVRDVFVLMVGVALSPPVFLWLFPGFYSQHERIATAVFLPLFFLGALGVAAFFVVALWMRVRRALPASWGRSGRLPFLAGAAYVIAAGLALGGFKTLFEGGALGLLFLGCAGMLAAVVRWVYAPGPDWADACVARLQAADEQPAVEGVAAVLEPELEGFSQQSLWDEEPAPVAVQVFKDLEPSEDLPEVCAVCGAENEWIELRPLGCHQVEGTSQFWGCPACWRKRQREDLARQAVALGGRLVFGKER